MLPFFQKMRKKRIYTKFLTIPNSEILDNFGERNICNLNEKVDMVGHETKGMDAMSIFFYAFLDQEIETVTV